MRFEVDRSRTATQGVPDEDDAIMVLPVALDQQKLRLRRVPIDSGDLGMEHENGAQFGHRYVPNPQCAWRIIEDDRQQGCRTVENDELWASLKLLWCILWRPNSWGYWLRCLHEIVGDSVSPVDLLLPNLLLFSSCRGGYDVKRACCTYLKGVFGLDGERMTESDLVRHISQG